MRVMANLVSAHVVCPLDDLWTDADEESLGLPTAHQHDPLGGVVCQARAHGGTRPDRFCSC
jgi:hypothetical protein